MLTVSAACVKFVLFSSKSAAPADQCHNVPSPAPVCAGSAGCKQNNAACFYTSFTENLLFFLLSNHGWLNFIEEFFSLPTPLGFCCTCPLPRKGAGKIQPHPCLNHWADAGLCESQFACVTRNLHLGNHKCWAVKGMPRVGKECTVCGRTGLSALMEGRQ